MIEYRPKDDLFGIGFDPLIENPDLLEIRQQETKYTAKKNPAVMRHA
jgi:hypothetical protein